VSASTGSSIEPLPRYQDSNDAHEAKKQPLPKSQLEHGRPPVQKGHGEISRAELSVPQSEAPGVPPQAFEPGKGYRALSCPLSRTVRPPGLVSLHPTHLPYGCVPPYVTIPDMRHADARLLVRSLLIDLHVRSSPTRVPPARVRSSIRS